MTIIGVAGAIGSGKSFTQLKHGLKYVEERQKQLVTNFPINVFALRQYASYPKQYQTFLGYFLYQLKLVKYGFQFNFYKLSPKFFKKPKFPKLKPQYPWIKRLCENGGIIQIPAPKKIEALLIPESVVLLDEAGILLNSRDFANTSKQLLADLAQSRKDGCDLIWCAQFDEQVDRQLRLLTQFWIHCESLSVFDKKMRRPKLIYKRIFWFRCSDYQEWMKNFSVKGNHIKTRLIYSTFYEGGFLTVADKKLFEIYDSFKRLDKNHDVPNINTYWQCKLPKDYYFQKLGCNYSEIDDPYSNKNQPLWGWYLKNKSKKAQQINNYNFTNKADLISVALKISRNKNISPPYFKNMDSKQIQEFIKKHN